MIPCIRTWKRKPSRYASILAPVNLDMNDELPDHSAAPPVIPGVFTQVDMQPGKQEPVQADLPIGETQPPMPPLGDRKLDYLWIVE